MQSTGVVQRDVKTGFQAVFAAGCQAVNRVDPKRQGVHAGGLQPVHQGTQLRVGRRAAAVHTLNLVEVLFVEPQRHVRVAEQAHIAFAGAGVQRDGVAQADVQAGFQAELAAGRQLVQIVDVQSEGVHACSLQAVHKRCQFIVVAMRGTRQVRFTERERDIGIGQQGRQTGRLLTQAQQPRGAMRCDVGSGKVESVVGELQHLARRHPFAIQRVHAIDRSILALQIGEDEGLVAALEGDGDNLLAAVCRHGSEAVAVGAVGIQVSVAGVERVGPAAVRIEREVAIGLIPLGLFLDEECVVNTVHVY